ncbi:competence/damage-inducible protein CinA domain protein [Pseudomonas syringae pv. tomato T1]|nr:competence/damage-inducible protein CinA domain protein [Pseudomonas syringae pv. tomato T1]
MATYKKGLLYEELYEKQASKGLCQRALYPLGRSQKKTERNHGGNGQKARAQEKRLIGRPLQSRRTVLAITLQTSCMNRRTLWIR